MAENDKKSRQRISRRNVAGYICLGAFVAAILAVFYVPYGTTAWRLLNGTPLGLVTVTVLFIMAMFLLDVDLFRSSRRR